MRRVCSRVSLIPLFARRSVPRLCPNSAAIFSSSCHSLTEATRSHGKWSFWRREMKKTTFIAVVAFLSLFVNVNSVQSAKTPDRTPPTVPTGLTATSISSSQINLFWNASTDNVGVAGYKVFRNGSQIATTTQTSYSDTGLSPSTTYSYAVSAYDAAGNNSARSRAVSAATQAQPDNDPSHRTYRIDRHQHFLFPD